MLRAEAKAAGITRYPMSKPCKHGHTGERMTCSGTCCECLRLTIASNKHRSPEAIARRRANTARKRLLPQNKLQYKARTAVSNAVRDGRLIRPDKCKCGGGPVHGHHADYTKPLEVEWLCQTCHFRLH